MNDRQLNALIMLQLAPAMAAVAALAGVGLARNFQPRQQGAPSLATVHFVKLGDRRYGHPYRREVWNAETEVFDHAEIQVYESTYQFNALVPQNPAATTALTESDVLNIVSAIMQSDAILAAFRASEVGIQRVTEVRNPYFVDDRDRFEAAPSFDVVFTHNRTLSSTTPAVDTYEANISRV